MRRKFEPEGVGFLALTLEPDPALVREWQQKLGIGMRVAIAEGEVLGPLAVNQVPSTIWVDADGVIVAAASGPRSGAFFEKRTRELAQRFAQERGKKR